MPLLRTLLRSVVSRDFSSTRLITPHISGKLIAHPESKLRLLLRRKQINLGLSKA